MVTRQETVTNERLQKFETLVKEVYNIDDGISDGKLTLRSKIRDMADTLEQYFRECGQPEQVKEISNIIGRRFRDDKREHLNEYVIHALDDRFIRKVEKSSLRSLSDDRDLPVHCSTKVQRFTAALKELVETDPTELGRNGAIDTAYLVYQAVHKLEDFASDNDIELVDSADRENEIDKTNKSSTKQYGDKISQPDAPIPTSEAIILLDDESYELGMQYLEELKQWITEQHTSNQSQTLEQATSYRDMWLAELRLIRQINDRKSRRTMLDWAKILEAQSSRGGTGASSYSKRIVTDPTTGQPLINPRSLQPIFREITKEQIDARGPKYASELEQIIEADKLKWQQQLRYVEITCGLRDWRAHAAQPKLSSQA